MENFKDVTQDAGVKKKIIIEGAGDHPNEGQEVEVHYEGKLESGEVFDCSRERASFKFVLGQGQVIKGWELGVETMRKAEKAEFVFKPEYGYGEQGAGDKIPPNSTLIFEIELLDFKDKPKSKFEMDLPEKVALARKLKEEGVELFKQMDFAMAASRFEEGHSYLDKSAIKEEVTQEAKDLSVSLLLNMSNCYNNLKRFEAAAKKTSEALEIKENPKCYYYRGVAHANLEEFEKAEEDYERLATIVQKSDPGVEFLRGLINTKKVEKDKRSKQMFKSFFKTPVYDDKPTVKTPAEVPEKVNPENPKVFLDIKKGDQEPQRLNFELFMDKEPKTAENFRALCTGEKGGDLHYKNSIFHRIIKGFMMQGGDFENANGTGGRSIYGKNFDDENFHYKHSRPGLLSMANSGPNTNGSQFFITFNQTSWLDNKHIVFGKLLGENQEQVLQEFEEMKTGEQDKPEEEVKIVGCGELTE